MTHTVINSEPQSFGSLRGAIHEINITSLDLAGRENVSVSDVGLRDGNELGVVAVGQTNESVTYNWDSDGGFLNVQLNAGGDVNNNGDPGEVTLLFVGIPG